MNNLRFYTSALIGAMESTLDQGCLSEQGTKAVREIIKRVRTELKKDEV